MLQYRKIKGASLSQSKQRSVFAGYYNVLLQYLRAIRLMFIWQYSGNCVVVAEGRLEQERKRDRLFKCGPEVCVHERAAMAMAESRRTARSVKRVKYNSSEESADASASEVSIDESERAGSAKKK